MVNQQENQHMHCGSPRRTRGREMDSEFICRNNQQKVPKSEEKVDL